jgi:putative transposase
VAVTPQWLSASDEDWALALARAAVIRPLTDQAELTWDNVLSPLAGRSSKPVLIKYDPRNLSRVFYPDKNGHYWPIPYRNLGVPPISLWEQREAMKRLRSEGRRLVDERLIFETALAQRKLVDSARKSTRKRRNKERRQHLQAIIKETEASSDSAQASQYSPLPPFGVEEWS